MVEFKFNLVSAQNLAKKDIPTIKYLVDKIIIEKGLTYLVGPPASFKTNFAMLVALSGAFNDNVLGYEIDKPFRTMFIDEENGEINTKYNLLRLSKGLGIDIANAEYEQPGSQIIFACISSFKIIDAHVDALIKLIVKFKPNLIVIDNIARVMVGDERDEGDVAKILNLLKPIIETYGVSFIIIHHTRKNGDDTYNLESISGSRDFGAQCDNAFLIKKFKRDKNEKTFILTQLKSKFGLEMEPINFVVEGDDNELKVTHGGTIKDNIGKTYVKIKVEILSWMDQYPSDEYRTTEVTKAMKEKSHKEASIRKAIASLCSDGILKTTTYGHIARKVGGK